jgi:hypothetical membrane protein
MKQPNQIKNKKSKWLRFSLWCGVYAGPLFAVILLMQPLLKPGFDAIRHPGSSLALGPYGWVQSCNFLLTGILLLLFALGLRRIMHRGNSFKKSWAFIAYWAIGLIGAGLFTSDPVNGYPLGTPNITAQPTLHGTLHDLLSVPAFILTALSFCFLFSRWFARQGKKVLAIYTVISGVIALATFSMAAAAFGGVTLFLPYGGLLERIAAFVILGWFTVVALSYAIRQDQVLRGL